MTTVTLPDGLPDETLRAALLAALPPGAHPEPGSAASTFSAFTAALKVLEHEVFAGPGNWPSYQFSEPTWWPGLCERAREMLETLASESLIRGDHESGWRGRLP